MCGPACCQLFDDMRKGKFEENAATLRLKMDMLSPNPNMWDQVSSSSDHHRHSLLVRSWHAGG